MSNRAVRFLSAPFIGLRYNYQIAHKLVSYTIKGGKKSLAITIVNEAFDKLFSELKAGDADRISEIISRIETNMMVPFDFFKRRLGSKMYKIPYMMVEERAYRRSLKALYKNALKGKRNFSERLYKELYDTYMGIGNTVHEKMSLYKEAWANRALVHVIGSFKLRNPEALQLKLESTIIKS